MASEFPWWIVIVVIALMLVILSVVAIAIVKYCRSRADKADALRERANFNISEQPAGGLQGKGDTIV